MLMIVEERSGQVRRAAPTRRRLNGAHVVWALLVAATLPWRTGVYYEGGADSVVLAKGALSVAALLLALVLTANARQRLPVAASPILWVLLYLGVSLVGAQSHGTLAAATVVAARVAILALTISLLMSRYSPTVVAASLVHVLGVVVVAAAVSGMPSAAQGRLAGVIPPVNPNELAFLACVCFLWCFSKLLTGRETARDLVAAAGCLGVVLLTGSRASLAAFGVAAVLMTLRATSLTQRGFALVMAMGPVLAFVVFGTNLFSTLFSRGGEQAVSTLSNRTIAWDAALSANRGGWDTWFGAGLTQKRIEVPGQWWTVQLLDSTWISALVQTGLLGLAIVVLLSMSTFVRSLRLPRATGSFWIGGVSYLCLRGFLESGLFDASTSFLLFFVIALACRAPRTGPIIIKET